jgi:hypothetical protein
VPTALSPFGSNPPIGKARNAPRVSLFLTDGGSKSLSMYTIYLGRLWPSLA